MPDRVTYGEDGMPTSIVVWPPSAAQIRREKVIATRALIHKMSAAELRDATESQMTCPCGSQLALTSMGLVCANLECTGPRRRRVKLLKILLSDVTIARAWPDRIVSHDMPYRSRLKQFGDGLKQLGALDA
jgi:hypothetical protein